MAGAQTARRPGGHETLAERNIRLVARVLMSAREITAVQLGELLGVTRAPIFARLRGSKPFTTDEVARMAEIFGVPAQVFYDGPEAMISGHAAYMGGGHRGWKNDDSSTILLPHVHRGHRNGRPRPIPPPTVWPLASPSGAVDTAVNDLSQLVTDWVRAA